MKDSVSKHPTTLPSVDEQPFIEFRPSDIHGMGGYARQPIPTGTRVIEYIGERIDKAEAARRCEAENYFIFTLDDEWDLDGDVPWNPARFLNHSCAPNCEAELDEGRIWIVTTRDIVQGEELSFNYGYDIADYEDHPCRCGASNCLGYMVAEEFFAEVRQRQATSIK
jgi:SET domain-containing protein